MEENKCEITIESEVILGIVVIQRTDCIEAIPLTSSMSSGDFPDMIEFDGGLRGGIPGMYGEMEGVVSIHTIPALPNSKFYWGACTKHHRCEKVAYQFPGKAGYSIMGLENMFKDRYCDCRECEFNTKC